MCSYFQKLCQCGNVHDVSVAAVLRISRKGRRVKQDRVGVGQRARGTIAYLILSRVYRQAFILLVMSFLEILLVFHKTDLFGVYGGSE